MNNRYETELVIKTEGFKRALNNASKEADSFNKKVQKSFSVSPFGGKIDAGVGSDFTKAFNEATRVSNIDWSNARSQTLSLNDATKETTQEVTNLAESTKKTTQEVTNLAESTKETSNNMNNMGSSSKNVGKQISASFKNGINSIKRLTIGFLGARSAFSLFRKYMSEYQSQNEDFNNKMQLTTNIITNALAPAFEFFGNVIQYAVIGLARIVELLTGVNILGKTIDNSFKGASKSAKEFNDNLTGLDEISNIDTDASGLSAGIQSQLNALDEFQKKIAEVDAWLERSGVKKFFEGLKFVVDIVREAISKTWNKLIESFGTGDFSWIGKGLQSGFELAAQLIGSINWEGLGSFIGNTISSLILDTDWIGLGKSILNLVLKGITSLGKFQYGLIDGVLDSFKKHISDKFKIDGESLGGKLASAIINGYTKYYKSVIKVGNPLYAIVDWFKGKANGGVFTGGSWHQIQAYAGGGLPDAGQMFVARESGPEMVGTIGGHTAVINNDQIVASVSSGVYEAVMAAMGGQSDRPIVLNVNGKEFAKATYGDFQEESFRRGTNTSIRRV